MKKTKPFFDLEFSDAFLFAAIMEDEELCRGILCRILEIPVKKVIVHKESTILINPEYRGIRMDVYADDAQGTVYDIEMQTTNKSNLPKRSRCYQGQMDVAALVPGTDFNKLPMSYIIFICTFDPFGNGLYRYTYRPLCQENGELLHDGTCRIFLNTKGRNTCEVPPELISFLRFVEDATSWMEALEDKLLLKLHERVSYLKHSRRLEERYMLFGEMLDDERREAHIEGRREGHRDGHREGQRCIMTLIQTMYADGKSEDIPKLTSNPEFLEEMLTQYHIVSDQETV